jgi:hypothetical protein
MNKPIKIVRALWGKAFHILKEIPKQPIFPNEIVFVWGSKNNELLQRIGYKTILISNDDSASYLYASHLKHYGHKLEVIKMAEGLYDEYLFLDWDIGVVKNIDDEFYNIIRNGNNIQCPIYAYNKNYRQDILEYYKERETLTNDIEDFLKYHIEGLKKYSWQTDELYILPNFCFFYSNKTKSASELHKIMIDNDLDTCIEEFAMWIYSNCSLDEYILKYEPVVVRGKERDVNLPNMDLAFKTINEYVGTKVEKKIYLYHELQQTSN